MEAAQWPNSCYDSMKYYEMYNLFYTYEVQDPAHSTVPSAGQNSEIRNIPEEVQPANKHSPLCTLLPHKLFFTVFHCVIVYWKLST